MAALSSTGEVEPVIGIDLGTTYSCVAVWNEALGRVDVLPNSVGARTTPVRPARMGSAVPFADLMGTGRGNPFFRQLISH